MRLKPVTIPEAQGDLCPSSQTSGTSKLLVVVPRHLACFGFQKEAALILKCISPPHPPPPPHLTHVTGTFFSPKLVHDSPIRSNERERLAGVCTACHGDPVGFTFPCAFRPTSDALQKCLGTETINTCGTLRANHVTGPGVNEH